MSEEHKLRSEVKHLIKEQDENAIMKLRHEKETTEMREEIKVVMSMIRQNPGLVQIKLRFC
jgi:hypothetical protein